MEYLFLRRKRTTATSERQKALLYRAARRKWEETLAATEAKDVRKVDGDLYTGLLYELEIRRVFLDASLSLKKLSGLLETNPTYLSNVVNRYFGCNLKELINRYRVEYAGELLRMGRCPLEEVPQRCGFRSRSAFYAAFGRQTGTSPLVYRARERRGRD